MVRPYYLNLVRFRQASIHRKSCSIREGEGGKHKAACQGGDDKGDVVGLQTACK